MSADTFLSFDISTRQGEVGGVVTVRATGEIDLASADRLSKALNGDDVTQAGAVILDLRDVAFIDSSGLRVLMTAERELAEFALLVATESPVDRLFELTEINSHLSVFFDEESAFAAVSGKAEA
jgi:anti-anti-sigma factor